MEGLVVHYNRIRLIASSILFFHEFDGSFSKTARERVRFDVLTILNWTSEMVLFVVSPNEFSHEPLSYPPILEAAWLGDYPNVPYLDPDRAYGEYNGRRRNHLEEVVFGPQSYLEHLIDNWDFDYKILERLETHKHYWSGRNDGISVAWADRAIECWYKNKGILFKMHKSQAV